MNYLEMIDRLKLKNCELTLDFATVPIPSDHIWPKDKYYKIPTEENTEFFKKTGLSLDEIRKFIEETQKSHPNILIIRKGYVLLDTF